MAPSSRCRELHFVQKAASPPKPREHMSASTLTDCVQLVRRSVEAHDETLLLRALRKTNPLHAQLAASELAALLAPLLPGSLPNRQVIFDSLGAPASSVDSAAGPVLPEVELYLRLVALKSAKKRQSCAEAVLEQAADAMMQTVRAHDRRTMDVLAASAWQTLATVKPFPAIRDALIRAHRTACLRLDQAGQAVLANLILRDLVNRDLITEAASFASKVKFPDRASNNQHVRFLYYTGRIEALQLEYGTALNLLQQSIRKAPTNTGLAFRIMVHKLATVVQLLTGDTPERAWFSDAEMSAELTPYLELVRAVRQGSIAAFEQCVAKHRHTFERDRTLTLIMRLHSSVIKMGLRAVNVCYSRIALADVARKLDVPAESIEYVCCKAVLDGVLDANVDPAGENLLSLQAIDVYQCTPDPMRAFQRRCNFLSEVHNEAVKAMRFPPEITKKKLQEGIMDEEAEDPAKFEDMADLDGEDDD